MSTFLDTSLSPERNWSAVEMLTILDRAETIAWIHGDTETARRLAELSLEVRESYALSEPTEVATQ